MLALHCCPSVFWLQRVGTAPLQRRGFSLRGLLWMPSMGPRAHGLTVVAHGFSCSQHEGSSWTRDRTHVSCIGRWTLPHWATSEAPEVSFYFYLSFIFIICEFLNLGFSSHFLPSSTLAWKIPWMEEPGGLPSMGSLRVGHDWAISLSLFTFMHWRRKWQPTPVFLPVESKGRGSLVGCRLWGRTELDTTEAT